MTNALDKTAVEAAGSESLPLAKMVGNMVAVPPNGGGATPSAQPENATPSAQPGNATGSGVVQRLLEVDEIVRRIPSASNSPVRHAAFLLTAGLLMAAVVVADAIREARGATVVDA